MINNYLNIKLKKKFKKSQYSMASSFIPEIWNIPKVPNDKNVPWDIPIPREKILNFINIYSAVPRKAKWYVLFPRDGYIPRDILVFRDFWDEPVPSDFRILL